MRLIQRFKLVDSECGRLRYPSAPNAVGIRIRRSCREVKCALQGNAPLNCRCSPLPATSRNLVLGVSGFHWRAAVRGCTQLWRSTRDRRYLSAECSPCSSCSTVLPSTMGPPPNVMTALRVSVLKSRYNDVVPEGIHRPPRSF